MTIKSVEDNLILDVHEVSKDGPADYVVRCPHCKRVSGVEGEHLGEIKGEQYQHANGCGGWLQVSTTARFVERV